MSVIKKITARQILDSRGNPTVEVDMHSDLGNRTRAAVPSGASTGTREAVELRDGDKNYFLGKSVLNAVKNINDKIGPSLIGKNVQDQETIDALMISMDDSEFKKNLGANAILAVSMANARLGAKDEKKDLFAYLHENLGVSNQANKYTLPTPLMNIINGGEHADNNLNIQEFMIVPHLKKSFSENLRAGVEIFHHLKKVLSGDKHSTNVGDEGGFAPNLKSHSEAIEYILKAVESAGYRPGEDISISLDAAASEFYKNGSYHMEGKEFSAEQMVDYYSSLCDQFPIYSIEDGLDESDYNGWIKLNEKLGKKVLSIGDDLFVTNKKILQKGIDENWANSILVKVNQIGSLTETFETLSLAFANNYSAVISHRSGETADHFIADLAVASGCGHIKTGSASRSDRMSKYNQLLRIEEILGDKAVFNPVK